MNTENLHKLIDRYEEGFYVLNNSEHDEIFKWRAARQFRDVWFSNEAKTMPFSEKFNSAKKKFSILTDNSYVSPSNGIVKIAEKERFERERQIAKLTDDLRALEIQKEQYESISLLNIEVFQSGHGKGIVTAQHGNKITVKFEACEKVFAIHKKYPMRPKFENDAEITEVFTEYDSLCRNTDMLKRKLNELLSPNCNTSRIQ